MLGKLPKKLNEVCMEVMLGTKGREVRDTIPIESLLVPRELIITNAPFPGYSWRGQPYLWDDENDISERAVLVCRWKLTEQLDDAGKKVMSQGFKSITELPPPTTHIMTSSDDYVKGSPPSEKHSHVYPTTTVLESQVDPNAALEDHEEHGLQKSLKPRHLVFISIGACVGTGIFLGVGSALKNGGPLGLLIGYSVIASIVVSVMLMVCELTTFLPVSGGHIRLAGRMWSSH